MADPREHLVVICSQPDGLAHREGLGSLNPEAESGDSGNARFKGIRLVANYLND